MLPAMAMLDSPKKPGGAQIKKNGHTYSGQFGIDPNAKVRGRSTEPTPISFP